MILRSPVIQRASQDRPYQLITPISMQHARTCEFVSPMHPDKLCDFISDSVVDAYLAQDPKSRVAVETLGGHGVITLSGEVTSTGKVDLKALVQKIVGPRFEVHLHSTQQSPEIARGVDDGGAGDQGIMVGYATAETSTHMPLPYETARRLCRDIFKKYPYDGKVQVTTRGSEIATVVASFQHAKQNELLPLVKSLVEAEEYFVNPAGDWDLGGFDADSGLTGRKIVVDAYGPDVPVGGGAFSGKDYTKVDRSGAYMARRIAVDYLKKYRAQEVLVKLAFAIGKKDPVMATAIVDGVKHPISGYDLTPRGIKELLKLDRPIYAETSTWGHFGNNFVWDGV